MKQTAKKSRKSSARKSGDFPLRKTLYAMVAVFLAILAFNLLRPVFFPPVQNVQWGVSFSTKYAREFGNDWRANFTALLDDMGIKNYRLMSYWDEIEPAKNQYDFADLDWQIDQIGKRGGTVSLAVGLRQPRWPECHAPDWARVDDGWQNDLYKYVEKVIDRYENNPAVTSWQLENEYKNGAFGLCQQFNNGTNRAADEMKIIRERSSKPVYMSLSDQVGLPIGEPTPDAYGVSIYGRFYWDISGTYLSYPNAEWWHRLRGGLIKIVKDRPTFVHEMQMEPWAKTATFMISTAEQDKTMRATMIPERFDYARRIGSQNVYLWGGEWWYWRLQNGDPTVWDAVKADVQSDAKSN